MKNYRRWTRGALAVATAGALSPWVGRASAGEYVGGATGSGIGIAGSAAVEVADGGPLQSSIGYITPYAEKDSAPTACLEVKGRLAKDGAPIIIAPCDGSAAQSWRLLPTGDLRGLGDKCLNVGAAPADAGTPFIAVLGACGEDGKLTWNWAPDRSLQIQGGLCLAIPDDAPAHPEGNGGTQIAIEGCSGVSTQSWMVHGTTKIVFQNDCLTASNVPLFYPCSGDESEHWVQTNTGWIMSSQPLYLTAVEPLGPGDIYEVGLELDEYRVPVLVIPAFQYWAMQGPWLVNPIMGCLQDGSDNALPDGGNTAYSSPCGQVGGQLVAVGTPLSAPLMVEQLPAWDAPTVVQMLSAFWGRGPVPTQCELVSARLQDESVSPADAGAVCCAAQRSDAGCGAATSVGDLLDDQGYAFNWSPVAIPPYLLEAEIAAGNPVPFEVALADGRSVAMLVVGYTKSADGVDWVTVNDPGNSQFGLTYKQWATPEASGESWTFSGNYFNIVPKL